MKKGFVLLLIVLVFSSFLYAGGSGESKGPKEIIIWSPWTGNGGAALAQMAEEFNAMQNDYKLELTYQGSANEIFAKYQAADKESRPDGVMISTEHVAAFIDQGESYYYPVQKFIDEDGYDITDLFENLRTSYSKDGKLLCVPTGNTVVGFFYNTELLRKAGIDPLTDLGSLEEIEQACYKLAEIGVQYPWLLTANSINYTFMVTAQGLQYVDNNNGADDVPTRCLINEEPLRSETVKFFQIYKNLSEKGLVAPIDYSSGDGNQGLVNGDIAMRCYTISGARTIGNLSDWTVEIGFHPAYTISKGAKNHGQCTGGGCMFITNKGDEGRARGIWEFMKFMMSEKNTALFATSTGYLPTTKSGYNSEVYQEFVNTKFPTAIVSKQAQENTESTCFNAWLPEFGDIHQIIVKYLKLCINDPTMTAEQLTDNMAAEINESIKLYNMTR